MQIRTILYQYIKTLIKHVFLLNFTFEIKIKVSAGTFSRAILTALFRQITFGSLSQKCISQTLMIAHCGNLIHARNVRL